MTAFPLDGQPRDLSYLLDQQGEPRSPFAKRVLDDLDHPEDRRVRFVTLPEGEYLPLPSFWSKQHDLADPGMREDQTL